jgi:hypothetical protein
MNRMISLLTTEALPWTLIGSWTAAAAATPAVGARQYRDVRDLAGALVFESSNLHNALELRFTGTTDGQTLVFDLMASRGQDYFDRVATLTCTVGTMQKNSATVLFVDTIVLSNERWLKNVITTDTTGHNYIARVALDMCGYSKFALVATTINGTATAEYAGF